MTPGTQCQRSEATGREVVLLTGDVEEAAERMAGEAGIEQWRGPHGSDGEGRLDPETAG